MLTSEKNEEDQSKRQKAVDQAFEFYRYSSVSPVTILAFASHLADFVINGNVDWPDKIKPVVALMPHKEPI